MDGTIYVVSGDQDVKKKFPKVFQGLRVLRDEYHIKLEKDTTPYALSVPRKHSHPSVP